jgi:cell wall-associated NlpC family hydrolase
MTGSTTPITYSPATVENYMHENLGSFSMLTAEQINDFIKKKRSDSPFVGNGQVFIDAAIASGLDPRYILAHAAVESAWGTSRYARERGNYFGIGAFDSNPDNAYTMGDTLRAGIIEGAKWIAKNYYHGKYGQTSIYKMRYNGGVHQYCTSTTWVNTIAKIMAGMPANTKLMLTDTNSLAVSSMSDVPTGTSTTANSSSYTSAAVNSAIENTYNGDTSTSGTSTFDSLGTMFGKLFSSAFGGVGKLFGFDFSDSSSSSGTLVDHSAGKDSGGSDTYGDTTTANTVLAGIPFDDSTPQGKSQRALVEKMASLAGTLDYSMDGPRDPSKGSADCSSTVNWVYKNVLGTDVGNTTYAMYTDPDLSTIDMATGLSKSSYNNRTSGPNLNNLQPGDVVLYSRNGSYTSGRDYKIGHVSMYMGDGKVLSHGGGKGPVVRDLTGDTTYVMARRYTPFVNNTYNHSDEVMANTAGAPYSSSKAAELEAQRQKELEQAYRTGAYVGQDTSTSSTSSSTSSYDSSKPDSANNIKPINAFSNNDKYAPPLPETGSGSGLVRYNIAQDGYNSVTRRHRGAKSVFGGSSGLVNLSKYTAARKAKYYMQTLNDLRGGDSGIGNEVLIPLIKGIISLLTNVSANSDQIKEAVVVLNKILEKTGTSPSINSTDMYATEKHIGANETDETIMEMQKLLQNLASGA